MTCTPEDARWHALGARDALARLASDPQGLAQDEAAARLARDGPNRLTPPAKRGPLRRLLAQFNNVLLYVLLGAAVVTALLGEWVDTAVIVGVVVINAVIGFVQEGKAEAAIEAIRQMLSPTAVVRRAGRRVAVPAEELVRGDVVLLRAGDRVPADLRLLESSGLEIEEAVLTGESLPVAKGADSVAADAPLAERPSMAWAGTLVAAGTGAGVVVATADATALGRITRMVADVEATTTPLLRQMGRFGHQLTVAILAVAALTVLFGVFVRGYGWGEMFLAAVGLAVAAIPEGLPAVMTITLAIGVTRMARRRAIIRRLPAVETLGSVTVICSDKTGTLTRNELAVQTACVGHWCYQVETHGYAPVGSIRFEGRPIEGPAVPELAAMAHAAALCNEGAIHEVEGRWQAVGNAVDAALLAFAGKLGRDREGVEAVEPRLDALPFDSARKFMATLHAGADGGRVVYLKGAPERVLALCDRQRRDDGEEPIDAQIWHDRIDSMTGAAERVIAIACRRQPGSRDRLAADDVAGGYTLLGLFGLADPPREDAITAVALCREAGITVKMITGDHPAPARASAERVGLARTERVLTGSELDRLPDAELSAAATDSDVFARTTPEHKIRLVTALQARGEVVAMTGDGVNDAPALKRADIGIAMGIKGTEAAKEAAQMVLADDNFASIERAVEEGRTVYDNLKKAILVILPTNAGQALLVLVAVLLGLALPVTPVQILWVNMVTAVTLGLALAFEPGEPDLMRRPPRPPGEPILSGFLVWRLAFIGTLMVVGGFGLFLFEQARGMSIEAARTAVVNGVVASQAAYLLACRRILAPGLEPGLWRRSPAVLVAIGIVLLLQVGWTWLPPMQALFQSRPLDLPAALLVLGLAALTLAAVELEKLVLRRRQGSGRPPGRLTAPAAGRS
ncbi:MAG TPA: HAD-IC family P-type ATPase [Geminicoccaceae bacterium]|nr:HAD-IC family P-type ATPase [Geminicoccaceae bacterium]